MSNTCHTIEELAGLALLGAEDPRCRHLNDCPRCQSRLLTYREFLAAEGSCDAGLLSQSVDRLGEDLDREIFGEAKSGSPVVRPNIFHWRSTVVRSVLATAAMLLLFFAWDGIREPTGTDQKLLRSDHLSESENDSLLAITEALDDGGRQWSWQPVEGADSYRIDILDTGFNLLVSLPVEGKPICRLSATRLQELLPQPDAYFWVVVALQGGDVVRRSEPLAFFTGPGR